MLIVWVKIEQKHNLSDLGKRKRVFYVKGWYNDLLKKFRSQGNTRIPIILRRSHIR